jgi:hypothetical protein
MESLVINFTGFAYFYQQHSTEMGPSVVGQGFGQLGTWRMWTGRQPRTKANNGTGWT